MNETGCKGGVKCPQQENVRVKGLFGQHKNHKVSIDRKKPQNL